MPDEQQWEEELRKRNQQIADLSEELERALTRADELEQQLREQTSTEET